MIRAAGAYFFTLTAIISMAFCGCSQAEVRTAAVVPLYAFPGVPDKVLHECHFTCIDAVQDQLNLSQPYGWPIRGENAKQRKTARVNAWKERGNNAWTMEALERTAKFLKVDMFITANIYSYGLKPDSKSVPRPHLDIEYLYIISDQIKGAVRFARILSESEDDATAAPKERLEKAVEVNTNRFIKRLLEEFD
ncbi:MAG: hypothetical protein E3J72_10360 [Planctomycetota bacterium]|nr:MAG: hypothetical protein E3J72_10360 [Planctomycetota bacterium]